MSFISTRPLPIGPPLVEDVNPIFPGSPDNSQGELIVFPGMKFESPSGFFYEVVDNIGSGQFGRVYRVSFEDRNFCEVVFFALKVSLSDQFSVSQFYCERDFLLAIRKNLSIDQLERFVVIRDFFIHEGHACIIEDLCGPNLLYALKSNEFRGFPLHILQVIASETLTALASLHSIGLFHTDIKPNNIAQPSDLSLHIKLLDFGCCLPLDKYENEYIQSRFYRSPEICLRLAFDSKVDIWSIGCTLCEMYLGLPIFPAVSECHLISLIEQFFGPFPTHMVESSPRKSLYFNSDGSLKESDILCSEIPEQSFSDFRSYFLYNNFDDILVHYPIDPTLSESGECIEQERRDIFIDLLHQLMAVDPNKRLSASSALEHPFFKITFSK